MSKTIGRPKTIETKRAELEDDVDSTEVAVHIPPELLSLKQEDVSLQEHLFPLLIQTQREFLVLRTLGIKAYKAMHACERNPVLLTQWRVKYPNFRYCERLCINANDDMIKEAREWLVLNLKPRALLVIALLVKKGMNWGKLSHSDKGFVMRAVELALKIGDMVPSEGSSYEEIIFKARRSLDLESVKLSNNR